MPRAPRSGKDCGKTPTYVPSKGDYSSSDEDTISVSGWVAQALQSLTIHKNERIISNMIHVLTTMYRFY